jgi:hypothetical protein
LEKEYRKITLVCQEKMRHNIWWFQVFYGLLAEEEGKLFREDMGIEKEPV